MGVSRARVELKEAHSNAQETENFKKMFAAFKRACVEAKIQHQLKQREFYETPGEKKRRRKRESQNALLKAKLKENFPEKKRSEKP